jgi:hypothetical protein
VLKKIRQVTIMRMPMLGFSAMLKGPMPLLAEQSDGRHCTFTKYYVGVFGFRR